MKRTVAGILLIGMVLAGTARAEEKTSKPNLAPNPGFEQPTSPEGASPENCNQSHQSVAFRIIPTLCFQFAADG